MLSYKSRALLQKADKNYFDTLPTLEVYPISLTPLVPNFRQVVVCLTNYRLERSLYAKLKDWMSNSVDPVGTAHDEPSHLDLRCLQKPIIIDCGSKRVNKKTDRTLKYFFFEENSILYFIWTVSRANIYHYYLEIKCQTHFLVKIWKNTSSPAWASHLEHANY